MGRASKRGLVYRNVCEMVVGEPKSKRSQRTLRPSTLAVEVLGRHRAAQLEMKIANHRRWLNPLRALQLRQRTPGRQQRLAAEGERHRMAGREFAGSGRRG